MSEIKLPTVYRVDIIESERGWGQKIDETKYFTTEQEAKMFCQEYNKANDLDYVPDWYMVAQYCGKVN